MPEIRLELPGDLVRKLDTEVELLGFDDREAYLRWIVGNRAAIEGGTERDQLLSEYQERVAELEAQLDAHGGSGTAEGREASEGASEPEGLDAESATGGTGAAGGDAERSRATDGSGVRVATSDSDTSDPTGDAPTARRKRDVETGTQTTFADTSARSSSSTDEAASNATDSPDEASNRDGPTSVDDEATPESAGESNATDEASAASARVEAAAQSTVSDLQGNFRPERVERFEDESLGSQANQLQGVEGERLDEFARRAVAKTRKRLGREPSTGLDYRSQTRISRANSDVRPGEDLVDLDSLDVPGRSEDAMEPRREAVGAALAYLRDVGRAKRGDFIEELYAEYDAGYDSKSGWWRCIKRGLKDAPVVDGGDGSRVWTYVPPGSREGELLGSGPKRVVDPD
jgi:hypothetical protein